LTRLYSASAFNIAIQDGEAAGQSVPHVHVHVIPRKPGDMDGRGGGDAIYEMMEGVEGNIAQHQHQQQQQQQLKERDDANQATARSQAQTERRFPGPDNQTERKPRTESEMRDEADMLRRELQRDGVFSTTGPNTTASTSTAELGAAAAAGRVAAGYSSGNGNGNSLDWTSILRNVAWMVTGAGLASVYILSNRRSI
jgi:diadenosine tetraphosphate (Ap4A) HIT family hydrolase